jgi:hypothetical protein
MPAGISATVALPANRITKQNRWRKDDFMMRGVGLEAERRRETEGHPLPVLVEITEEFIVLRKGLVIRAEEADASAY